MKNKTHDFAYHLTKFFTEYLPIQRNLSPNTISTYRYSFQLLLTFFDSQKHVKPNQLELDMLTRNNIEEFIVWLQEERDCGASTCNQRLGALKSFFNYLQFTIPDRALQCQKNLAIKQMKQPEPGLKYLTIEGIQILLEQPDLSTKYGRRDLALLSLMYDTGARVQEIADIQIAHIRFSAPATIRLTGKGDKTRVVPLLSRTEDILKQYIREFKLSEKGNETYLFQNRQGEQLSRFGIAYVLTKYADMARSVRPDLIPEKLSPHCIRHSKAMHLLQANVNLVYIRDLLGHTSVTTTEIYARADTALKRAALEKANPIKDSPSMPQWKDDEGLMDWLRNLI
jgi:integrase/recombinase XerD